MHEDEDDGDVIAERGDDLPTMMMIGGEFEWDGRLWV